MADDRNFWTNRHISRRAALRGAGLGMAGLAGAALIGCGDDDEPTAPAARPAATATATAAQATAAPTVDPSAAKRGGTFLLTDTQDPATLDPYGSQTYRAKTVGLYTYSRLFRLATAEGIAGPEVPFGPDVAESFETPDGITWTIKLKPGVKMQNVAPLNGRDLTTEDVLYSWGRLSADESPNSTDVAHVESVDAVDDRTLVFKLNAPSPVFIALLGDPNDLQIMPVESDGGFDPAQKMIGSGPWIMDEYTPSVGFKYSANPEWHEEGFPLLDKFEVVIVPEYANRIAQFEGKNISVVGVNANDLIDFSGRHTDTVWSVTRRTLQSFIYFAPTEEQPEAPWVNEPRVRHAFSMALDRDALTEFAYNVDALAAAGLDTQNGWNNIVPTGWGPAGGWLDPKSADHGDSGKFFQFDPTESRKLLDAAGYPDGFDFKYQYVAGSIYGTDFDAVAEAQINMFQQIGLNPDIETQDYRAKYFTQTWIGNFTGVAYGYETPFPEVGQYFNRQFGDDPANHSRIDDPEMTDLVNRQAKELDREARVAIWHDIQRANMAKGYYLPSQAGANFNYVAYQPEIRGVRQNRSYGYGTEVAPYYWIDA